MSENKEMKMEELEGIACGSGKQIEIKIEIVFKKQGSDKEEKHVGEFEVAHDYSDRDVIGSAQLWCKRQDVTFVSCKEIK